MATDLERLVVMLSADITRYERTLAKALGQTDRTARGIEKRFTDMNRKVGRSFDFGDVSGRALGALGVGISASASVSAISAAAQQYVNLQNQLKVTGLEGAALEKTFNSLFQIAQKNGTAIEPLVTLYSRLSQAQKELGASTQELEKFSDGVAIALRVAGTSSTQASGAMLQLSQALGGGVVRAEEFNSVNEGARPILQAVAAGLEEAGGSVSKLKTLVNDGKISSEAFFRAFLAGMPQIESQVAKSEGTVGQANARIANSFILLAGKINEVVGVTKNVAASFNAIADVLDKLGGYFDAASKKIEAFQAYLTSVGNNPVFAKIAKMMGADLSPEGLRAAGITPPQDFTGPGGRIAEGARDPSGRAPAPLPVKPVSLRDFKVPGKDDGGSGGADPFQRSIQQAERRTAVLKAETETIDLGRAAQARARVETELMTAAVRANEAAGMKNTEVTEAQRKKITEVADAYMRVREEAEKANSPLATFARQARDTGALLQEAGLSGIRTLEDGLVDIVTGAENAEEAIKRMADAIIADIARIAIRQAITGPIANALGGVFGGGGGLSFGGARASGGPVQAGRAYLVGERGPELMVPGRNGVVIPNAQSMQIAGSRSGGAFTFAPQIDARGADAAAVARLEQVVARQATEFESRVKTIVRDRPNGRW